jgi:hypothetical protein
MSFPATFTANGQVTGQEIFPGMSLRRRLVAAVERFQPVSRELVGFLRAHEFPDVSAALVIANGTAIGARTLSSVIDGRFSSVMVLADTTVRAEQIKSAVGPSEILKAGAPLSLDLPGRAGFCGILSGPAQMREICEELLFEQLPEALADRAVVAVQFCRDASEGALHGIQFSSSRAKENLRDFLSSQFETTKLDDDSAIVERFAGNSHYEYLGWCPRDTANAALDPFVWLVLRKRPGAGNRPAEAARRSEGPRNGFSRTPNANQFLLSDFNALVSEMRQADINLIPAKRYANRLAKYAARPRDQNHKRSFGLLKFDIHGNIRRPLEMAKILSRHSANGLFLMMPRHPLNEHFYDQPSTWRILQEIQSLGHEVGIHIDPFNLVTTYGNLYTGLDAALSDFRSKGIVVSCATLHGDSRAQIKERKLQANDFFHDGVRKSKWDGKLPKGEVHLAEHIHGYSFVRLANDFGITYFPEVNFLKDGHRLTKRPITYLSDNVHAFALRTGADKPHLLSQSRRLDPGFLNKALALLGGQPFLALFHPQWYW